MKNIMLFEQYIADTTYSPRKGDSVPQDIQDWMKTNFKDGKLNSWTYKLKTGETDLILNISDTNGQAHQIVLPSKQKVNPKTNAKKPSYNPKQKPKGYNYKKNKSAPGSLGSKKGARKR